MLVKKAVIGDKTFKKLNFYLNETYKFKEGKGLDSVLSEILNDRDLNLFLLSSLPKNKGLILVKTGYFNDYIMNVKYGLAIDLEVPRRAKLFVFEENNFSGTKFTMNKYDSFPDFKEDKSNFKGRPSPEEFAEKVNALFLVKSKELSNYLVDLSD